MVPGVDHRENRRLCWAEPGPSWTNALLDELCWTTGVPQLRPGCAKRDRKIRFVPQGDPAGEPTSRSARGP